MRPKLTVSGSHSRPLVLVGCPGQQRIVAYEPQGLAGVECQKSTPYTCGPANRHLAQASSASLPSLKLPSHSQSPLFTLSRPRRARLTGVNNLRGGEDPPEVSQEVNTGLTASWPHRTHPLPPLTWTGMLGPPGGEMRRGPRERNSDARRLGRSSPGNVITLSVEGIYSQVLHCSQSPSNPLLTR